MPSDDYYDADGRPPLAFLYTARAALPHEGVPNPSNMPLYVLYYHAGSLSFEQKQTIAKEVTDAHCAVTGAGPYFVKVAFQAFERGDYYTAGDIDQKHIRFVGYVRRGRDPARMHELLRRLYRSVRVGQPDETVDIEMHVQEADADVSAAY